MAFDPRAKFIITAVTDFAKADRESKTFVSSIQSAAKVSAAAVAALASVAAVSIVRLAAAAAESADQLAKQADLLGISTQKLAAYQLAARLSGVSNEGFEKGLRKLQKAIIDAGDGITTYKRAFDKLKLDPAELRALTPDQQFEALAKAFAGLERQIDRVAVGQDLFGGRNVELVNTLVEVGRGMNKLEADTLAWGNALSRVDARKIEQANDAVERAQTAVAGVATSIALAVAPFREQFANAFADSVAAADGFKSQIQATMEALVVGANFAANSVRGIALAFKGAELASLKFQEIDERSRPQGGVAQARGGFFAQLFRAEDKSKVDALIDAQDRLGAEIDAILGKFQSGTAAVQEYRQSLEDATRATAAALEATTATPAVVSNVNVALEQIEVYTIKQREALSGNVEALKQSLETEVESIRRSYIERQAILEEAVERGVILDYTRRELQVRAAQEVADKILAIEKKAQDDRRKLNEQTEKAIRSARAQTADLAVGLLQALGSENKAFAVAAIILEKALAIQRLLLANRVAAELAFASQLIPGDPTSLARAAAAKAAILTQGTISAALIAATGIAQIATLGSGSTGAPLGTETNPVITQGSGANFAPVESRRIIEVRVYGNGILLQDQLTKVLRDAVDADEVIIYGNSRQAAEIRTGR